MKRTFSKLALVMVILAVIFMSTHSVLSACAAISDCGAWCETFGDCQGNEKCEAGIGYAMCTCGSSSMIFGCIPKR